MTPALFLIVSTVVASAAVPDPGTPPVVLPAPLQVEAVRVAADPYDASTLGPPRVVVDLGGAEGRERPDRAAFEKMTLLGTRGAGGGTLEEIVKVCNYLCSDEAEECHYVAHVVPAVPIAPLCTVVGAIPGEFEIEGYSPLAADGEPAGAAGVPVAGDFTSPIWPEDNPGGTRHRLRAEGESFVHEYAWGSSPTYEMPVGKCSLRRRGPLDRWVCSGLQALAFDGTPLLVSIDDYNIAEADVLASLEHGGETFFVIRLGLKAQTVHGLLYRDGTGRHALIHPRDYALLC
jgi:hypothetical protein